MDSVARAVRSRLSVVRFSVCFLAALGCSTISQAYDSDYSPYPAGKVPQPFSLRSCAYWCSREHPDQDLIRDFVVGAPDDDKRTGVHLRIIEPADGPLTLEVLRGNGSVIVPSQPVAIGSEWASESADLNRDGVVDFVVEVRLASCGLAACGRTLVFVISHEDSYRVSSVRTSWYEPHNLIDAKGDGRCEFIHVAQHSSGEGDEKDGRSHNYWVYHKLEIREGRLVIAAPDRTFPKWVWYSFRSNRKATARLSESARKRIWRETGGDQQIHWVPDPDNRESESIDHTATPSERRSP